MHLMPTSVNHVYLDGDRVEPFNDNEPNIQELDNSVYLVGNGSGPHIDQLKGENTARHVFNGNFRSHGTSDDLHPKEVNKSTHELDEDFDNRDL
ncbi:hypothetical protein N7G274_009302 [Stereocaulon virgatum]|uniref:Uncharacterized protein n=1 Tax=Stereocaulon virgatum TaxID=373712 RepID=A0ABR3ZWQ8_9LECA